ncbi:hypothetical protein Noda2021_09010 [Candidatus Dependentiae bacterium Noda2021]|nr:hypothetical protein Noda2021_09010 [Candidatus Dependentiae bacterium Noda2021]
MKNLCIALILLSFVTIEAQEWQSAEDIGFEIRNHDTYPITVTVSDATLPAQVLPAAIWQTTVPGKGFLSLSSLKKALDINRPSYIFIQYKDQIKVFEPKVGKTWFVAWENGNLRPQQGRKGKTLSGYSLANNVTSAELLPVANPKLASLPKVDNQQKPKAQPKPISAPDDEAYGEL